MTGVPLLAKRKPLFSLMWQVWCEDPDNQPSTKAEQETLPTYRDS